MKIEKTKITSYLNSSISVLSREEPFFQAPFHSHPELELVYVKESFGKRIVGNSVEPFKAGDMVFLGSNIPHVWLNDEVYYQENADLKAKAIVVYFKKEIFGTAFFELKETQKINSFFNQAVRGLAITGETNLLIAKKLEKLVLKKDFEMIAGLFKILALLSESTDINYINSEFYVPLIENSRKDKLSAVFEYLEKQYNEEISLVKIAEIANLTPTSFCRLFRLKTKKSFVAYLNEIRVSNACKMLIETDLGIAEIAYKCGYKTVSNFNQLFKKINKMTPKDFRNKI